jgi:1,4-alpha-glucan branching enzyme
MKIVFWTDAFWPRKGGIETHLVQLITGLQKKGHECLVVAQKDRTEHKEEEIYRGITIKRFDFRSIMIKRQLNALRLINDYLNTVLQNFEPDIVHLHDADGMSAFTFSFFRKKFSIPIIFSMHLHFDEKSLRTQFIAKIASLADLICCISRSVFEEMELCIPSSKNKLRLIYYGLSVPNLTPSPISFSDPVLVILGRFVPQKGFDTAIRAFSLLKEKKPTAKLLIGGYGTEQSSLEHLVKDLKLTGSVEFFGEVQRENVPSFINRSTIMMVPSNFEPFGLVALEGMQMARPMIVSHVGGLKEFITDRKTGLFVPPQNPIALCDAIEYLLDRPEEAIQMGKEARKEAIEKFKLEYNVDRHIGLYSEAIEKRYSL